MHSEKSFERDPKTHLKKKNKNDLKRRHTQRRNSQKNTININRKKQRRKSFLNRQVSDIETIFKPQEPELIKSMRKRMNSKQKRMIKNKKGSNTPRRKKNNKKQKNEKRETRVTYHQFNENPKFMNIGKHNPFSNYILKLMNF